MPDESPPSPEIDLDVIPVEDLFDFTQDPIDFMSAESFPASDPPSMQFAVPDTPESD